MSDSTRRQKASLSGTERVDQTRLIDRVLARDPNAERELYDQHVDRIYRLAYRMVGDADLASDYTQDTFVRAFDRLAGFRGEAAFSTWLTSIAISVIYNGQRKVKRIRSREVALDTVQNVGTEDRSNTPLLQERLHDAVNDLPEGYRTVFLMHDVEGYTHQEIASVLSVREGTSKAQLSRARARLRLTLADLAGEWIA